ncbi:MAG: hypothetical protein KKE62_18825 [Proteobacteria bacterium]|nr:hypothetical protein [Bacteroidota bacterium]MBU1544893.1 hypothetical protein [Pseudomonadota bacterium]MBU2429206.1 hypothetical protein [Pseudomonadota bacterium]
MASFEGLIIIAVIIVGIYCNVRFTAKQRSLIKKRSNWEYEKEIELTKDELESRLGEAEIMYEDLEEQYWTDVALLVGIMSYLYWHIWYISLLITLIIGFTGIKYLTIRPFKTGIPD